MEGRLEVLPAEQWLTQIMQALESEVFDAATAQDVHTILAS